VIRGKRVGDGFFSAPCDFRLRFLKRFSCVLIGFLFLEVPTFDDRPNVAFYIISNRG